MKKVLKKEFGIERGFYNVSTTPIGQKEKIPYINIGSGNPTLTISATLHGNEVCGSKVLQELRKKLEDMEEIEGSFLILPNLNPTGLRGFKRSYTMNNTTYTEKDPNRSFPTIYGESRDCTTSNFYYKIYNIMSEASDYYVDLHSSFQNSIPHSIRTTIIKPEKDKNKKYKKLDEEINKMLNDTGLRETVSDKFYQEKSLTKSQLKNYKEGHSIDAMVNKARIPSIILELTPIRATDYDKKIKKYTQGLINIASRVGILKKDSYNPVKYEYDEIDSKITRNKILSNKAGLLKPKKKPGSFIKKGETICELEDLLGLDSEYIKAEEDCILLSYSHSGIIEEKDLVCIVGEKIDNKRYSPNIINGEIEK